MKSLLHITPTSTPVWLHAVNGRRKVLNRAFSPIMDNHCQVAGNIYMYVLSVTSATRVRSNKAAARIHHRLAPLQLLYHFAYFIAKSFPQHKSSVRSHSLFVCSNGGAESVGISVYMCLGGVNLVCGLSLN